jgi:malate synthase
MKIDLSVPAIREVVEFFSATIKTFRNQNKLLRAKNKALKSEVFHTRSLAIRMIMGQSGCSFDQANAQVDGELAKYLKPLQNVSIETVN